MLEFEIALHDIEMALLEQFITGYPVYIRSWLRKCKSKSFAEIDELTDEYDGLTENWGKRPN